MLVNLNIGNLEIRAKCGLTILVQETSVIFGWSPGAGQQDT